MAAMKGTIPTHYISEMTFCSIYAFKIISVDMNIQLPKTLQEQNKTINFYATCKKKEKHKKMKNGRSLKVYGKILALNFLAIPSMFED
jgi:hypothetical protein